MWGPGSLRTVTASTSTMVTVRRVSPATGTNAWSMPSAASSAEISWPVRPPENPVTVTGRPRMRSTRATFTALPPARTST